MTYLWGIIVKMCKNLTAAGEVGSESTVKRGKLKLRLAAIQFEIKKP